MKSAIAVVTVMATVLLVILIVGARRRARPAASETSDRIHRLIALCYDDRDMAERLIAGEARRSPGLGRRALVDRAIERLQEDRRR